MATLVASDIGLPLGFVITLTSFPGKRLTITCLNTLLTLSHQFVLVDQNSVPLCRTDMEKSGFWPEGAK